MEPSKVETKFEFVVSTPSHNASSQKDVKRFVRKHVMRRFKRHKTPPRVILLEDEELTEYLARRQHQADELNAQVATHASIGSPSIAAAFLGAARTNPFGTYPINMGSREDELVHHIWASNVVAFQPFRDYWFSLGMIDPAAMHLVIANAAMHRKSLRSSREDDMLASTHSLAAISSMNQRISVANHAVTDELMGAVLGLLCQSYLTFQFENCAKQINGIQKMLQLRGGLTSIEFNLSIRLTLFWIEHNIAVAQDIVPQFPPPIHLMKSPGIALAMSRGLLHQDKAMRISRLAGFLSSEMLDALTKLSVLTVTLRGESVLHISWTDPNFPGFNVYPVLHTLLAIQNDSQEDNLNNAVQEMCRLGSILFIAEVRRKFGISPVVTTAQSTKLHNLLDNEHALWREDLYNVRIWAIVMAGCAASTQADRAWAVNALIRSKVFLKYENWKDMIDMVSNMWWIDEVFTSKSQRLQSEYIKTVNHIAFEENTL